MNQEARQSEIEYRLGITDEEARWLNESKGNPVREAIVSLLRLQCQSYDPAGFAMLEEAVTDMRQGRLP